MFLFINCAKKIFEKIYEKNLKSCEIDANLEALVFSCTLLLLFVASEMILRLESQDAEENRDDQKRDDVNDKEYFVQSGGDQLPPLEGDVCGVVFRHNRQFSHDVLNTRSEINYSV